MTFIWSKPNKLPRGRLSSIGRALDQLEQAYDSYDWGRNQLDDARDQLKRVRDSLDPEWRGLFDQFWDRLQKHPSFHLFCLMNEWERFVKDQRNKPPPPAPTGLRLVVNNKPKPPAPKVTPRWRPPDDGPRAA
jgi:hypothetical protein